MCTFSRLKEMFDLLDKVLVWFQSYWEQYLWNVYIHDILSDV